MENKGNKNPQSNLNQSAQNQSAQSSSQSNRSTVGSSAQSPSGSSSQSAPSGSANISGTSGKGGLNNITSKLQQFGSSTMDKVNNLTTTQKVVGGSLLALGAGWVAMNSKNKNKVKNLATKSFSSKNKGNKNPNRNA